MVGARLHHLASVADNPIVRAELRRYADDLFVLRKKYLMRDSPEAS